MQLTKIHKLLISVFVGVLLALPFQSWGSAWFGFIAWAGWFFIDEHYYLNKSTTRSVSVFWWAYLSFVVWNGVATWWIVNASGVGAALAVLCNPLFMALVVWAAHVVKRKTSRTVGYVCFVALWLAYEWLHLHWDLSWPWLQLGNSFANNHSLVQWYEYTGVLGGSLWLLLVGVLLFEITRVYKTTSQIQKKLVGIALASLLLPIVLSFVLIPDDTTAVATEEAVIVQPNIDPYGDELDRLSPADLCSRLLSGADKLITPNTKQVLLPECALPGFMWENTIEDNQVIKTLREWSAVHHNVAIVTGAITGLGYECAEAPTATARGEANRWYDVFNSALYIVGNEKLQIYHKSQLVLGVEKLPLTTIFPFFKSLAESLGGSANSLGTQDSRTPFVSASSNHCYAPAICYESVYGSFLASYNNQGAEAILLITNDGWWGNTPGYKQHLSFSRLRAIESRRAVLRCANTGVSGLVLPSGEIQQQTNYGVADAFRVRYPLLQSKTLYVRFGDWIGALACVVLLGCLLVFVRNLFAK